MFLYSKHCSNHVYVYFKSISLFFHNIFSIVQEIFETLLSQNLQLLITVLVLCSLSTFVLFENVDILFSTDFKLYSGTNAL